LNGPSFANVYCPNDDNDRRVLWDELVQLCSWWDLSRCIGGDFNIIRYSSEISSETRSSPAIFEFTKLIFDQGLMNIPLVGGNFTWSNNEDPPSWSKIDRFLLSLEWKAQFPKVSQRRGSLGCYQITFHYCLIVVMYFKFKNVVKIKGIWG